MKISLLIATFLLATNLSYAEVIKLSDDSIVEGSITTFDEEKITISMNEGVNISYYLDEILLIDGKESDEYFKTSTKRELFHPNGKLAAQYMMKNGKINGIHKTFYPNGNLQEEASYINGKKEGPRKTFYPDGNLHEEEFYTNDQVEGYKTSFYKNGNKYKEEFYIAGQLSGEEKIFYTNTNMYKVISHENNGTIETSSEYDPYGILEKETFINFTLKTSLQKTYYEDGSLKSEVSFKNKIMENYKEYCQDGSLLLEVVNTNNKTSQQPKIAISQKKGLLYNNGVLLDGKIVTSCDDHSLSTNYKFNNGHVLSEEKFIKMIKTSSVNYDKSETIKTFYQNGQTKKELLQDTNSKTIKIYDKEGFLVFEKTKKADTDNASASQ